MTLKETLKYMESQVHLQEVDMMSDPTKRLALVDDKNIEVQNVPKEFWNVVNNALANKANIDEMNEQLAKNNIKAKLAFLPNTPMSPQAQQNLLDNNTSNALINFSNNVANYTEIAANLIAKQSNGGQLTPQENQELQNAEVYVPKSELDHLIRSRGYYKGQLTKANNQISNLQNELQSVQQELAKLKEIPALPDVNYNGLSDEDLEKQIAEQSKKAQEYLDRISYLTDLANRLLKDPKLAEASNKNKKIKQKLGGNGFLKGLLNTAAGVVGNFIGGIASGMGAAK